MDELVTQGFILFYFLFLCVGVCICLCLYAYDCACVYVKLIFSARVCVCVKLLFFIKQVNAYLNIHRPTSGNVDSNRRANLPDASENWTNWLLKVLFHFFICVHVFVLLCEIAIHHQTSKRY